MPSLTSLILPVPFQRLLLKKFLVFMVMLLEGKESFANAVMLTRVAFHGPPPAATEESATLAKEAMDNYPSTYGEKRDIVPCNRERE